MKKGKYKLVWGWMVACLSLAGLFGCQPDTSQPGKNVTVPASGRVNQNKTEEDRPKVLTTIFPYYDFVRQIGGDHVDVEMIVPAGMDTHSFEPTAADMIRMGEADLLIYNGGEMETWVPQVIEAAESNHLATDAMMNYVDTFQEEHVEGMEEEKGRWINSLEADEKNQEESGHWEGEHPEGEVDEHIWTSPVNAQLLVVQIAKDLVKLDPGHKDVYLENAQNYVQELEQVHRQLKKVTEEAADHYLVFGDRFPLRYFVEEYDLEYTAAFAGCSSDTEPSADTIACLTDQVRDRKLPVVLKIELTSSRVADAIAEAAGAQVRTLSTCHNVTREQFQDGITYLELMEQNISVLKEALGVK